MPCTTIRSTRVLVKAGIVGKVGDYDWSSWKEYTSEVPAALSLCATNAILKRMSLDVLKELVEAPLDDNVHCLDLDESIKISVGDREIRQHLLESYGITDSRCRRWTRRNVMR